MTSSTGTPNAALLWRPDADQGRPPLLQGEVYRPDILAVIERTIDGLRPALRTLSAKIHARPELKFEEQYAHDEYTHFMETQGFVVQRHYLLDTAWIATYTHHHNNPEGGAGAQAKDVVLGVNSEMDALPGIGHACGHNLIGIAGVAIACAVKAAMVTLGIDGKVVLLGTPGEEGGSGKVRLWEKGAYEGLDVCLMCHPAPGPPYGASLSSSLAVVQRQVDYAGHTAHAGLSPWEGQNALDAAVLAYTNVGLLRQQIKPTHRVHGVFGGQDWAPNIIPDQASMHWYVRAPTTKEVFETAARVKSCFEAAATATGCPMNISYEAVRNELVQNKALGEEFADVYRKRYGEIDYEWGIAGASTDFGNVSYLMPGLHPGFSVPTVPGGGNHTREFTHTVSTDVAHEACYDVSKALAHVGMRVLTDEAFLARVKAAFEADKKSIAPLAQQSLKTKDASQSMSAAPPRPSTPDSPQPPVMVSSSLSSPGGDPVSNASGAYSMPMWLSGAIVMLQTKYPEDRFEVILRKSTPVATPEWRVKCLDCPGNLYNPGPGDSLSNYEVHLKNRQHRLRVTSRVNGTSS